jgi:hypothetical protein
LLDIVRRSGAAIAGTDDLERCEFRAIGDRNFAVLTKCAAEPSRKGERMPLSANSKG